MRLRRVEYPQRFDGLSRAFRKLRLDPAAITRRPPVIRSLEAAVGEQYSEILNCQKTQPEGHLMVHCPLAVVVVTQISAPTVVDSAARLARSRGLTAALLGARVLVTASSERYLAAPPEGDTARSVVAGRSRRRCAK